MEKEETLKILEIDATIVDKVWDNIVDDKHNIYIKLVQNPLFICHDKKDKVRCFGWKTKIIRDKILTDYPTYVHIQYPRFQKIDNGEIVNYLNLIAKPGQRVSKHLIKKFLEYLRKITATYTQVAELTNISVQEVQDIFDKHVSCPRGRLPKILCLDECHNKSQFGDDKYSAILSDFLSHNIVDVVNTGQFKIMTEYFSTIPQKERLNVEFVCMDMWKPYKQIVNQFLPNATIVIDSFHVLQTIKACIKNLEMEIYYSFEEGSKERQILKKYFNQTLTTYEIKKVIMKLSEKLAASIKLLDSYKILNATCNYEEFDEKFRQFINDNPIYFDECFSAVRTMFDDWYDEIKNSFQVIEIKIGKEQLKRLSNGLAESLNNLYKELMRVSNGVKDFERFRRRLMYCINKIKDYIINL